MGDIGIGSRAGTASQPEKHDRMINGKNASMKARHRLSFGWSTFDTSKRNVLLARHNDTHMFLAVVGQLRYAGPFTSGLPIGYVIFEYLVTLLAGTDDQKLKLFADVGIGLLVAV